MKRCALPLTLLFLALPSFASADLVNPAGFTESNWISTANEVTGIAWAPDGSNRLFLTRKGGQVRIIQRNANGSGTLLPDAFATLTPIYTVNECGLNGIAFDPDFVTNGFVYFFITVSGSEQQVVRYTAVGNTGMNKMTIMPGLPTAGANHDGGGIGFGADGMLYWAIGDLGNGTGVDGDLASLAAKVGRATRMGGLPADNPFADGAGGNNDYTWARGFRNPFTLTFQPTTGLLWVNVVGTSYEQIFVVRAGDHAGYNDYENNQPAGYITPAIAYETNNDTARTFTITAGGAVRSGNIVTFTTNNQSRPLRQGERVTVTGVTDTSFNGTFYVATGPSAPGGNSFTVVQNGPNASSGGGSVATMIQGRVVGGGTFYDSTAFPAQYRGNFFYGDYISGRVMRAVVGPVATVQSVDYWSTNLGSPLDQAVGPDGALYTVNHGGTIYRTVYNSPSQNIIVSEQNVRMLEGGGRVVSVSLANAPTGSTTVNVARTGGDTDVSVTTGGTLTFTAANYSVPQTVRLDAAQDSDETNDMSTVTVSSSGLTSHAVTVHVIDDDSQAITLSRTTMTLDEGTTDTFTVRLATAPTGPVTVTVARTSGDSDITVSGGSSLMFNAGNFSTPQTVTVQGGQDGDNTDDMATLTISAPGGISRTFEVLVIDDEDRAPVITSTADTTAVIGATYMYDAEGNGSPVPTWSLTTAPPGMVINATTGLITYTPQALGTYPVTITLSNGVNPAATQSFDLVVSEDQPPMASITLPNDGDTVSGMNAEFYGDGIDDVLAVRAEFYIDGDLVYTDPGSEGHFHINGAHMQWNTTLLSDGQHTLRMVVYDAADQTGMEEITVTVNNSGIPADGGGGGGGGGCTCRVDASAGAPPVGIALAVVIGIAARVRRRRK